MICDFNQILIGSYDKPIKSEYILPNIIGQYTYGNMTIYEYIGYGEANYNLAISSLIIRCSPQIAKDGNYVVSKCSISYSHLSNCKYTLLDILNNLGIAIKFDFETTETYDKNVQNGALLQKYTFTEIIGYAKTDILSVNVRENNGFLNGRMTKFK